VASTLNGLIVPVVYKKAGLGTAFSIGVIISMVSLMSAFFLALIDKKKEKINIETRVLIEDKF